MRAPRPLAARRRGASIIEILVVLGLAGLVAAALVRMLLSQTRIFERQSADQDARSIARAALGLLASDLRMVDGVGGIVAASAQSFTARVPYAMGILCRTDPAVVSLLPGVPALDPNPTGIAGREGPYGYAWRDSLSGTYQYVEVGAVTARPATVLEAAACTGAGVTTLTTAGGAADVRALTPAVVAAGAAVPRVGSPVFLYQRINYRFEPAATPAGATVLRRAVQRRTSAEESDVLAGPFDAATAFGYHVGAANTLTAAPAAADLRQLRGVAFTLVGRSERVVPGTNQTASQGLSTAVYFHNR
jgi:hypothetical protein